MKMVIIDGMCGGDLCFSRNEDFIPIRGCRVFVAGVLNKPMSRYTEEAVSICVKMAEEGRPSCNTVTGSIANRFCKCIIRKIRRS